MDLGLSTSILGQHALPEGLAAFADHGVPWVEIHGYTPEEFDFGDRALVESTARAFTRFDLDLWSCHSPAVKPLDLASSNAEVRLRSCAAMEDAMGVSADLGARVFVCDAARSHPEDSPGQVEARRRLYADSLRRLLSSAARLNLRLAIENQPHSRFGFRSPEDFFRLEEQHNLDGLAACWDTGHGWIAGLAPGVACSLETRLATLHIHDNDGQHDRHWLPTTGTIAWEPFVSGLRRIDYGGPFMMELVPPQPFTTDALQRAILDATAVYERLTKVDRRSEGLLGGSRD